jgi:hypothetical protein
MRVLSSLALRLRSGQTPRGIRCSLSALVILAGCRTRNVADADVQSAPPPRLPTYYELGSPIDSSKLATIDIDVDPTGAHLPPGSGTVAAGLIVYVQKCAICHGGKGEGIAPAPKLIGRDPRQGFPFGRDAKLVKTVGNYWPYSTTLYDYIHRAMPLSTPGSLAPNEVYSVVAWLLAENEIIPRDAVIDAKSLPAVKMPAVSHFVVDDRKGKVVR